MTSDRACFIHSRRAIFIAVGCAYARRLNWSCICCPSPSHQPASRCSGARCLPSCVDILVHTNSSVFHACMLLPDRSDPIPWSFICINGGTMFTWLGSTPDLYYPCRNAVGVTIRALVIHRTTLPNILWVKHSVPI